MLYCCRANLDYVTDSVCSALRQSVLRDRDREGEGDREGEEGDGEGESGLGLGFDSRIPAIVESVMSTLSLSRAEQERTQTQTQTEAETETEAETPGEAALLRDMVLDILDAVDALAACGATASTHAQAGSLLKVMQVVVDRTTIAAALEAVPVPVPVPQASAAARTEAGAEAEAGTGAGQWGAAESLREFVLTARRLRLATAGDALCGEEAEQGQGQGQGQTAEEDLAEDLGESAQERLLEAVKGSPQYGLLVEIVHRCAFFLAAQSTAAQDAAYAVIRAALLKLRDCR
jgi:hypothetical protein